MPLVLKISKKTVVAILSVVVILANAAFLIWYFTKSNETNGNGGSPEEVQARIVINDNNNGAATLYVDLSDPSTIVGAELYFRIEGSLNITGVECKSGFDCFEPETKDSVITIIALRPPSENFDALSGQVPVVAITYTPSTSGILTMNASGIKASIVSSIDTENNLLGSAIQRYNVGSN